MKKVENHNSESDSINQKSYTEDITQGLYQDSVIQRKLQIGHHDDPLEKEADEMANRVMRMPESQTIQRKCTDCEEEEEKINRKPLASQITPFVQRKSNGSVFASNQVTSRIQSSRGRGKSLPPRTKDFMESRFGADFSAVRVHTGSEASGLSRDLNSKAFTVGKDVYFNRGEYVPESKQGKKLLAHELTHVVQQSKTSYKIQKAEVDDSATSINCPTLADSKSTFNTEVNRILANARTSINTRFLAANPRFVGPLHISGPDMVLEAFNQLGAPYLPHLAIIENWANNNLPSRGGGTGASVTSGTRYDSVPWGVRLAFLYLAPVVKLNNICAGTDKIGHMFQQGFQYFYISQRGAMAGRRRGLGLGDQYARAWGEWMEGRLSAATRGNTAIMTWLRTRSAGSTGPYGIGGQSQGHFGILNTGVHSRGDLAANSSGLNFYRDLFNNPYMTFDISNYITANWNEGVSGNIFERSLGTSVRTTGRLNTADTVL